MTPIQTMKTKRKKSSLPNFSARRQTVRRRMARGRGAEASSQTWDTVASVVRVHSLTVTLCAPHPNKWSLCPTPDLAHTHAWGQLWQDTLHFPWWRGRTLSLARTPLSARTLLLTFPSLGDSLRTLTYTVEKRIVGSEKVCVDLGYQMGPTFTALFTIVTVPSSDR